MEISVDILQKLSDKHCTFMAGVVPHNLHLPPSKRKVEDHTRQRKSLFLGYCVRIYGNITIMGPENIGAG